MDGELNNGILRTELLVAGSDTSDFSFGVECAWHFDTHLIWSVDGCLPACEEYLDVSILESHSLDFNLDVTRELTELRIDLGDRVRGPCDLADVERVEVIDPAVAPAAEY